MFRATSLALAILAAPAAAQPLSDDFENVMSPHPVAVTMDRLEAAVTDAGATVFARVDHGGGAASAGMDLQEAELLIFGNPQLGTPILQQDIRAGLYLPMRVLVHATEGGSAIVWEEPEEMFDDLEVDDDLPQLERLEEAVEGFAAQAAAMD